MNRRTSRCRRSPRRTTDTLPPGQCHTRRRSVGPACSLYRTMNSSRRLGSDPDDGSSSERVRNSGRLGHHRIGSTDRRSVRLRPHDHARMCRVAIRRAHIAGPQDRSGVDGDSRAWRHARPARFVTAVLQESVCHGAPDQCPPEEHLSRSPTAGTDCRAGRSADEESVRLPLHRGDRIEPGEEDEGDLGLQ